MRDKKIEMLKEGQYVPWDGTDVNSIIVTETMTLEEMKKHFPTALAKICKGAWCCQHGTVCNEFYPEGCHVHFDPVEMKYE
jgi:hypothetical protein